MKHCDRDSARQDVLNFLHLLSVKYLKKYLTQSNIASRTHSVRDTSGDCLAAIESKLMELNTKMYVSIINNYVIACMASSEINCTSKEKYFLC